MMIEMTIEITQKHEPFHSLHTCAHARAHTPRTIKWIESWAHVTMCQRVGVRRGQQLQMQRTPNPPTNEDRKRKWIEIKSLWLWTTYLTLHKPVTWGRNVLLLVATWDMKALWVLHRSQFISFQRTQIDYHNGWGPFHNPGALGKTEQYSVLVSKVGKVIVPEDIC